MKYPSLKYIPPIFLCLFVLWIGAAQDWRPHLSAWKSGNLQDSRARKTRSLVSAPSSSSSANSTPPSGHRWAAQPDKKRDKAPFNTPQERSAFIQRAQRFATLWLQRHERRVTPELLQMLEQEPTPQLRERIVIALGRIEDPSAIAPLKQLLAIASKQEAGQPKEQNSSSWRNSVSAFRVKLAIGRIEARNLKGVNKLNKIASSMGTNWAGIQSIAAGLRSKLAKPGGKSLIRDSDQLYIVTEFFDVLYRMGKSGEDIRSMGAFKLLVWPEQDPLLSTALMSDAAELNFWLKRALPPSSKGFYPEHLLDLGPQVPNFLLEYLRIALATAKKNPKVLEGSSIIGMKALFNAAAATNDSRFIPILTEFTQVNDGWTRNFAQYALKNLRSGQGAAWVLFP